MNKIAEAVIGVGFLIMIVLVAQCLNLEKIANRLESIRALEAPK